MKPTIPEIKFQTPDLDKIIEKMDLFIRSFADTGDPRERFLLMYRTFKNELRSNIRQGRSWIPAGAKSSAAGWPKPISRR